MTIKQLAILSAVAFGLTCLVPGQASAHCDGLDGPVVRAAQKALDSGTVTAVLIWVRAEDEAEAREAFKRTMGVRGLSPDARQLADRFFFETVVRLHRAGEGAPYTGLAPAGRDLGPAIPAADQALDRGSVDPLVRLLARAAGDGLARHFDAVRAAASFSHDDLEAGRAYVRAYVEFIHYVERLHEAITTSSHGHFTEEDAKDPRRR
jgi:uncharacterized protein DUF6448